MIINPNEKIGIKPGSRNFIVKTKDEIIIRQSCVAQEVNAAGKVESFIIGDPTNIKSIFPLNRGIIKNETEFELLKVILRNIPVPKYANIIAAVPETELKEGKELLKKAILETYQPSDYGQYPESFCAAVTMIGVEKALNDFFTVMNLGSTTTGIGIFAAGEAKLLTSYTEVSGTKVDDQLLTKIKNVYGSPVANLDKTRRLKELFRYKNPEEFQFIDIRDNGSQRTVSCGNETMSVLNDYSQAVASIFIDAFAASDSTTAYNMLNHHIIFTGGMSNIPGLCENIVKIIENRTKSTIPLLVVEKGHIAPAIGAHILAHEYFS